MDGFSPAVRFGVMMGKGLEKLEGLTSWGEIPKMESVQDESLFWEKHGLSAKLLKESLINNDSRESCSITLRFDPRMLARIKRIARSRYLNYQSMIKQWLAERLDEEAKKSLPED